MLSVTQRIKTVSQPQKGYVPKELFSFEKYEDYRQIKPIKTALVSIQGLAVDYLSRFIISGDKIKSFDIPLKGARIVDETYESNHATENILSLINGVSGLDRASVINVCKIVCYDTAYRAGMAHYQAPDDVSFEDNLYDNVIILVERTLLLFKKIGTIVKDNFTFEGGYTKLVSAGDGDYLTKDTLIDLKTSKNEFSSKWSLQLLMYYILGIHSVNSEFLSITKLCIVNPYLNQYCICNIDDISDESKYNVSHDVLGYKMVHSYVHYDENSHRVYDYSKWKDIDGTDNNVLKQFLSKRIKRTDFNINNYGNGIFDITIDDYCTFIRNKEDSDYEKRVGEKPPFASTFCPLFRHTEYIKFIKHNNYYMFVSVSPKGKYSLLHKAKLHSLNHPLEYYYDKLQKYAETVSLRFSKYWDALDLLSKQIQSLHPDETSLRVQYSQYLQQCKLNKIPKKVRKTFKEWSATHNCNASGHVHGCIIDIDYSNHIYFNPYDGTIAPYYAISMDDKDVFENVQSLLTVRRPDLLESSLSLIDDKTKTSTMLTISDTVSTALISKDDIINTESVKEYSRDIYTISNRIKPLKDISDSGWIQVWYDDVLNENELLLEDKYKIKKSISDKKSFNKSDVYKQYIQKAEQKKKHKSQATKSKYIGKTIKTNCGLLATCIDYIDCKHITVQFEDGMIRTDIRSDHFNHGKVAHKGGYYEDK